MQYDPKHYTLDIIPKHRQKFIDQRIEKVYRDYDIKLKESLDTAKLIKKIKDKQLIPFNYCFVPEIRGNFDAQARYYSEEDLYMILINKTRAKKSYPYKRSKDRRLNFTLAHELGHIFLDHVLIPDEFKSQQQLRIEHEEAHEFAGRLLMPKDKLLSCNFVSQEKVAEKLKVSTQAIWKRLNNLKRLDLLKCEIFYVCETCGNSDINPGAELCRICGQYIFNNDKGVIPVKYEGFDLDENSHALECPVCRNEDFRPPKTEINSYGDEYTQHSLYCRICASVLINRCTNNHCEELAEGNSRYCEYCGAPTTFNNEGYLPSWEKGTGLIQNELTVKNELIQQSQKRATKLIDPEIEEIPF